MPSWVSNKGEWGPAQEYAVDPKAPIITRRFK